MFKKKGSSQKDYSKWIASKEDHQPATLVTSGATREEKAKRTLTQLFVPLAKRFIFRTKRKTARLSFQEGLKLSGQAPPSYKRGRIVEIIKSCSKSSISSWPQEAIGYLLKGAHIRFCHPGEIIVHSGEPAWAMGIVLVLSGRVRIIGKTKSADADGPLMLTDENVLTDSPSVYRMVASPDAGPGNFVDCVLINYAHFWHSYATILNPADTERMRKEITNKRVRSMQYRQTVEGKILDQAIKVVENVVTSKEKTETTATTKKSSISTSFEDARVTLSMPTTPSLPRGAGAPPTSTSKRLLVDDLIEKSWLLSAIASTLQPSSQEVVLLGHFKKLLLGAVEPAIFLPGDAILTDGGDCSSLLVGVGGRGGTEGSTPKSTSHLALRNPSYDASSDSLSNSILGTTPLAATPNQRMPPRANWTRRPPPLVYFAKGNAEIMVRNAYSCNLAEQATPYAVVPDRPKLRRSSSGLSILPSTFLIPPGSTIGEWSFTFNDATSFSVSVPRLPGRDTTTAGRDGNNSINSSEANASPAQLQQRLVGDMITAFTRKNRWASDLLVVSSGRGQDSKKRDPFDAHPLVCDCWVLRQRRLEEVMCQLRLIAISQTTSRIRVDLHELLQALPRLKDARTLEVKSVVKALGETAEIPLGTSLKTSLAFVATVECAALKAVAMGATLRNYWLRQRISTVHMRHRLYPLASLVAYFLHGCLNGEGDETCEEPSPIRVYGLASVKHPSAANSLAPSDAAASNVLIVHHAETPDVFPALRHNLIGLFKDPSFLKSKEVSELRSAVAATALKQQLLVDGILAQLLLSNSIFIDAFLGYLLSPHHRLVEGVSLPPQVPIYCPVSAGSQHNDKHGGGVAMILSGCARSEEVVSMVSGTLQVDSGDSLLMEQLFSESQPDGPLTLITLTTTDVCFVSYQSLTVATKRALTAITAACLCQTSDFQEAPSPPVSRGSATENVFNVASLNTVNIDAWYNASLFESICSAQVPGLGPASLPPPSPFFNNKPRSHSTATNASFGESFINNLRNGGGGSGSQAAADVALGSSLVACIAGVLRQALATHLPKETQADIPALMEALTSASAPTLSSPSSVLLTLLLSGPTTPTTATTLDVVSLLLDVYATHRPIAQTLHDFEYCQVVGPDALRERVKQGIKCIADRRSQGGDVPSSLVSIDSDPPSRCPSLPSKRTSGGVGRGSSSVGYNSANDSSHHNRAGSEEKPSPALKPHVPAPPAGVHSTTFLRGGSGSTEEGRVKYPSPPLATHDDGGNSPFAKTLVGKRSYKREYPNTAGPTTTFIHDQAVEHPRKSTKLVPSFTQETTTPSTTPRDRLATTSTYPASQLNEDTRPMTTGRVPLSPDRRIPALAPSSTLQQQPSNSGGRIGGSDGIDVAPNNAVASRASVPVGILVQEATFVDDPTPRSSVAVTPASRSNSPFGSQSSRPLTPGRQMSLNPSVLDRTDFAAPSSRHQGFLQRNRGSIMDRRTSILGRIEGEEEPTASQPISPRRRGKAAAVADESVAFLKRPGGDSSVTTAPTHARPHTAETLTPLDGRAPEEHLQRERITALDVVYTNSDNDNLLSTIVGGTFGSGGAFDGMFGAEDDALGQFYYLDEEFDDDFGFGGTGAGGIHQSVQGGYGPAHVLMLVQVISSSVDINDPTVARAMQLFNVTADESIAWKVIMHPLKPPPTTPSETPPLEISTSSIPAFLRLGQTKESQKTRNVVLTTTAGVLRASSWTTESASFFARLPLETVPDNSRPSSPCSQQGAVGERLVFELWKQADVEKYGRAESDFQQRTCSKAGGDALPEFVLAAAAIEVDPQTVETGYRTLDVLLAQQDSDTEVKVGTVTVYLVAIRVGEKSQGVETRPDSLQAPVGQRPPSSGSALLDASGKLSVPPPTGRSRAFSTSQQHRRQSTRQGPSNDSFVNGFEHAINALNSSAYAGNVPFGASHSGVVPHQPLRSRNNSFSRVASNLSSASIEVLNTTASGSTTAYAPAPHRFMPSASLRQQLRSPRPATSGSRGSSSPSSSPMNSARRRGKGSASPPTSPRIVRSPTQLPMQRNVSPRRRTLKEIANERFQDNDPTARREWLSTARANTRALLQEEWEAIEALRMSMFPDNLIRKKHSTELLLITSTSCNNLPSVVEIGDDGEERQITPSPCATLVMPQLRKQTAPPVHPQRSASERPSSNLANFKESFRKPGVVYTGSQQDVVITALKNAVEVGGESAFKALRNVLECGVATVEDTLMPEQFIGCQPETSSPRFTAVSVTTAAPPVDEDNDEVGNFTADFNVNNTDVLELTKWGLSSTGSKQAPSSTNHSPIGEPLLPQQHPTRPSTANWMKGADRILDPIQRWYTHLSASCGFISPSEVSTAASYKFFVCANPRKAIQFSKAMQFSLFICIHQATPSASLTSMLPPPVKTGVSSRNDAVSSYFSGVSKVPSERKPFSLPSYNPLQGTSFSSSPREDAAQEMAQIATLAVGTAVQSRATVLKSLGMQPEALLTSFPQLDNAHSQHGPSAPDTSKANAASVGLLTPAIAFDEELIAVGKVQITNLMMQGCGWLEVNAETGKATELQSPSATPQTRPLEPPKSSAFAADSDKPPSVSVYYMILTSIRLSLAIVFPQHLSQSGAGNPKASPSYVPVKTYVHLLVRVVGCEGLQNRDAEGESGTARVKAFVNSSVKMKCLSHTRYDVGGAGNDEDFGQDQLIPVAAGSRKSRHSEVLRAQTFLFQTSIKESTSDPVWDQVHEGTAVLELPLDELVDMLYPPSSLGDTGDGSGPAIGTFNSSVTAPIEATRVMLSPPALVGHIPQISRHIHTSADFIPHRVPTIAFEAWDEDPTLASIDRRSGTTAQMDETAINDTFTDETNQDTGIASQTTRKQHRGSLGNVDDDDEGEDDDASERSTSEDDEDGDDQNGDSEDWATDRVGCVSVSIAAMLRAALLTANSGIRNTAPAAASPLPEQRQTVVTLPLYASSSAPVIHRIGDGTKRSGAADVKSGSNSRSVILPLMRGDGGEEDEDDEIGCPPSVEDRVVGTVTLALGILRIQHAF